MFNQPQNTNLSIILPRLIDLSCFLKKNIITYEYTNCMDEISLLNNATIMMNYLTNCRLYRTIHLFGYSTGCVACFHMLENRTPKIKSIICLSPTWVFDVSDLKSSSKIRNEKLKLYNIFNRINQAKIPLFVIHGKNDTVVKYMMTVSLMRRISNVIEWYPKRGKHLSILNEYRGKMYSKIKNFYSSYTFDSITNNKTKSNSFIFNCNESIDYGIERKTFFLEGKTLQEEKDNENLLNISDSNNYRLKKYDSCGDLVKSNGDINEIKKKCLIKEDIIYNEEIDEENSSLYKKENDNFGTFNPNNDNMFEQNEENAQKFSFTNHKILIEN